ncbi:MAG: alpha/beta hydrolase [Saprospiraceae bacterium]|nr:alpha/beta hydrolase [Saprospiraceae bacterium]
MDKVLIFLFLVLLSSTLGHSQIDTCLNPTPKHILKSQYLGEERECWVRLPLRYNSEESYPVMYVFDAEWRLGLISHIVYDMGGNKKIPKHIVVGIPHVDWQNKRGVDLTFSETRNEYDGTPVDSAAYNSTNAGGGEQFYQYLVKELMPLIDSVYATDGQNILVGHSYGGYFNSFILGRDHPFQALQIYDPSIWYNRGEAIKAIKSDLAKDKQLNVFITYQPEPAYHSTKIKELIELLGHYEGIDLGYREYKDETHNSLYLISFLDGIKHLYKNWKKED